MKHVMFNNMTKEQLDELWELYREFVEMCNQNNMTDSATEFLSWIKKFKV